MSKERRRLLLGGRVQGVGFRPFVFRLASALELGGWVRNTTGLVEIEAEGSSDALDDFQHQLIHKAPQIAAPKIESTTRITENYSKQYHILESDSSGKKRIHIPPDFFCCADCLKELNDPSDRRYRYPFINCTQCGPRFTLIESLPYDRAHTSMNTFAFCSACEAEYQNPLDRRFHAEPIACPDCGPQLYLYTDTGKNLHADAALEAAIQAIENGEVVAVKGIGGYHLICDAQNTEAIATLRARKHRPAKPLALMFPATGEDELEMVRDYVVLDKTAETALRGPARPIVIVPALNKGQALDLIAPGIKELGVMLPYSPLHTLLLKAVNRPLVATSANLSGEPVLSDPDEVDARLGQISDKNLHHNRKIVRPADDSVFKWVSGKLRPIRLGRGFAPLEIDLPFQLDVPVLACGAHMKNTLALAWENRLVVSSHIGELSSPRSMRVFEQTTEDLQRLYQVTAEQIACDSHPGYGSTRWAKNQNLPLNPIQHHKAHASALALEYWIDEPWLIFSWDGTGYGEDGSIWGGETFYGHPGNWRRVATFRPFYLPGGDKAAREPWRSAAALCWKAGYDWEPEIENSDVAKSAWSKGINTHLCHSVGRLFDAAASLLGVKQKTSFEGEGPMLLEQLAAPLFETPPLPLNDEQGVLHVDWQPLLPMLLEGESSVAQKSALFHSTMAASLVALAQRFQTTRNIKNIGLCGGVFQNRLLADFVIQALNKNNFDVHMQATLPVNDACISAGQIVEAVMSQREA